MTNFTWGALFGFGACTLMIWVLHGLFDLVLTIGFVIPIVIYAIAKHADG